MNADLIRFSRRSVRNRLTPRWLALSSYINWDCQKSGKLCPTLKPLVLPLYRAANRRVKVLLELFSSQELPDIVLHHRNSGLCFRIEGVIYLAVERQLAIYKQEWVWRAYRTVSARNILGFINQVREVEIVILGKFDHVVKAFLLVVWVIAVDRNYLKFGGTELALQLHNVANSRLYIRAVVTDEHY